MVEKEEEVCPEGKLWYLCFKLKGLKVSFSSIRSATMGRNLPNATFETRMLKVEKIRVTSTAIPISLK